MKIVVDNKIPFIKGEIEKIADTVVYLSAANITAEAVKDADALVIRTRTKCDKDLLEGSKVCFIATATIGFDHIDIEYCDKAGIQWKNAPGCNSNSVRQYIYSSLVLIEKKFTKPLSNFTLGIVGVGHVGSKIKELADELGMQTLLCDPIRGNNEIDFEHTPLEELAIHADIITFHTPLTFNGDAPTYHLASSSFFNKLKRKPIVINTARGEVIETSSLKYALDNDIIADAIIDVWENEPNIDLSLLNKVWISTPHIAGYSADGKAKATEMALMALTDFLGIDSTIEIHPPSLLDNKISAHTFHEALLAIYNPLCDSEVLKNNSSSFEELRSNYKLRREQLAYCIDLVD